MDACNFTPQSDTPTDYLNTIQCRTKIVELISYGWTAALQWVPSHVRVPGNERAHQKAKQCHDPKNEEFWKASGNSGYYGPNPKAPRESRSCRPTTGHDFLVVYLHWLGVAANEVCPICGHARKDDDHLLQCSGLDEHPADDIVSRYWEARRPMVKKPSTGSG
ncbi:reverse transcriptase [Trichonephila clavipes]|nr:reverse transcriptase [Trichonephila clavipes]